MVSGKLDPFFYIRSCLGRTVVLVKRLSVPMKWTACVRDPGLGNLGYRIVLPLMASSWSVGLESTLQ